MKSLSPVLSSILLQPCIVAAEDAMVKEMGVSRAVFRRTCGVAAYLDDLSIVAPPAVAAVGLRLSVMWYVFTRIDNKYTWPTGRQHIHRSARSLKAEHPRSTADPHSVVLVVRPSSTPPNS